MFGKMFAVMVHTFVGDTTIVKKMQDMQQRRVDYWQLKNLSDKQLKDCLLYTSPSPRDGLLSRMPSSA